MLLIEILLLCIGGYLSLSSLYLFIFALGARLLPKKTPKTITDKRNHITLLVPSFKEDELIVQTINNVLDQSYTAFTLVVIADSFQEDTLKLLRKLPIELYEVSFENSSKTKSIQYALTKITPTDACLVLDADNLIASDFLEQMNRHFNRGYDAVQAKRVSKNKNTNFAILDSLSEEINNSIYNQGCNNLGLSSRIVGSGMLIEFNLFKEIMLQVKEITGLLGAEDKFLEMELIKKNKFIFYAADIELLDAKTNNAKAFKNQRSRWISAQYHIFRMFYKQTFQQLFLKNFDFFNKTLQLALPPRLLLMVFLGLGMLFHFFFFTDVLWLWLVGFLLNITANFISIPKALFNAKLVVALLSIPKATLYTLLSLFRLRLARKNFIHTIKDENS